jgi:hypothetical protein
MLMPTAFVMSINAVRDEVNSARPNAPTVPHRERRPRVRRSPRGHAVRHAIAGALSRAARAVAPVEPAADTAQPRCA